MSAFDSIRFNLSNADTQLTRFKTWLAAQEFVGETAIADEIRTRPQMACLLASTLGLEAPDMIRFELALMGMFKTDFVLNKTRPANSA